MCVCLCVSECVLLSVFLFICLSISFTKGGRMGNFHMDISNLSTLQKLWFRHFCLIYVRVSFDLVSNTTRCRTGYALPKKVFIIGRVTVTWHRHWNEYVNCGCCTYELSISFSCLLWYRMSFLPRKQWRHAHQAVSVYWEKGKTAAFNMANLLMMSKKQNIIVLFRAACTHHI